MSDEEFATQKYRRADSVAARRAATAVEQEAWNKERIVEAINDFDWTRSKADAFVSQIWEALQKGRGWRLDKSTTIFPYIERSKLPMDRDLEQSLRDAWSRSSFLRCVAFDKEVLNTASAEGFIDFHDSNFLLGVIQRLGKDNGWTMTSDAAKAAERQRWIENILGV